ncbi:MAG: integrase core domain-containing protein [Gammaproteobacteria bacterium]|nr:integrase core domain-containing protein [Gammaproteobacteria bacterium]
MRSAAEPGQTLNVDLCFVPATHEAEQKLPAVSGSSGRVVVERPKAEAEARDWPGRVFEDAERDYAETMVAFVAAAQAKAEAPAAEITPEAAEKAALKVQQRVLRQTEAALRGARRSVRQQRQQEDAAWRELRSARKQQHAEQRGQSAAERTAQAAYWRVLRQQRRERVSRRKQADTEWRQQRDGLREQLSQLPIITAWIAILVVTDNCTRQCLGLPLFVVGSKVTAEIVVEALRVLLPQELQFLISDRGIHFTAAVFQELARSEEFIHVLIARHRPQSNGIAERFVRTLKEWLCDQAWANDAELAALIKQFIAEYNGRPHQGLAIPGLSPNEFANRIWLM